MNGARHRRLPRLVLIADRFTHAERARQALALVQAGVPWVHLRDHEASASAFASAAGSLGEPLRAYGAHCSVNARLAVAAELGCSFHTGHRGPSLTAARRRLGTSVWIGYSAHDADEARAAVAAGADYLFYSPIFPTTTKPGAPGRGLTALRAFCATAAPTPVLALGGITPDRVAPCLQAGAWGVAVLSGLMDAADPVTAVAAYRNALAASPNP